MQTLEISEIILLITPLLTLAGTWIIKNLSPFITGKYTILVVAILSTAGAFLADILVEDGISWAAQLLAGSAAIVVNQIYRSLTKTEGNGQI